MNKTKQNKQISTFVDETLEKKVKDKAKESQRTVSDFIRLILKKEVSV